MRWPDGENTSARGWSLRAMNVASRRPNGSITSTPESVATATTSPHRVAATSLPAGSGRLVGGWSAAAVISLGGSAATSRWSAAPNSCNGTAGRGCGHATRTRRAAETTRPFASTVPLRSEEHTSELQSRRDLVCRLLLEKKKKKKHTE